ALPVESSPPYITAIADPKTGLLPLNGVLTIISGDHQPFHILAVQGDPPPFLDFDPIKDSPRDHYQLKWDLSKYDPKTCADAQGRLMPGWIAIETDHHDCPVMDVEVHHECTR